ncbi:hypothetical protein CYLTODRAFT_438015 [Cylindrobasidium torrendii FP15055 ss-10]|uniref:Formin GTPase-binding domain-containing protein n=1 Tax=Cylindrobasidium torrendii FP15055 ss-10 TaxID=1314674 RepID=A0A0D7B641_9AGAR|nr:hypothetical protein CYLTODRAFT_438015 [Cylindrobasidium torrendii FP15055 ss-10]
MFKGILPSKRISSTDFTMVTPADGVHNDKENRPGASKKGPATTATKPFIPSQDKRKKSVLTREVPAPATNEAFDQLLDDLQIPSTLRPKLAGMDPTVKAAMLKSSHMLTLKPSDMTAALEPPMTPRSAALRRSRSTDSLSSPRRSGTPMDFDDDDELLPPIRPFAPPQLSSHHNPSVGSPKSRKSSHSRGLSLNAFASRSAVNLPLSVSVTDLSTTAGGSKGGKDKYGTLGKNASAVQIISALTSTSSQNLDVELVKKLRLCLRNESASWSQDFLKQGGYTALLTRLNELLEIEWREEQHDDKILHELLRCFKALSTSAIGCFALRSSCPTPFVQLVTLLYSDKKPGDVATRQLIVEMLQLLFELYPATSLPARHSPRGRREIWDDEDNEIPQSNLITLPAPHTSLFSLLRALLLTPAPPSAEAPEAPLSPHEFIESLHRPRVYKTYLQELSDVCRDYFWVFCHPNNTIWILTETDEGRVEKPRAPGGMTGGVEFEAVGYFTTHMKLVNAMAKCAEDMQLPSDHDLSAFRLHSDLFLSGLERIILISRKASTTYYPTLHLELSRYIAFASRSGFELPYAISRLMGAPPASLARQSPSLPLAPQRPRTPKRSKAPPPNFMLAAKLDLA